MKDECVIIVAGGKGMRMGTDLPKQFLPIGGQPIIMHTIRQFYEYNSLINIILVLPVSHQQYWRGLIKEYDFKIPHQIADAGETRFDSVKNGLEKAKGKLIAVHDAVRPFISKSLINRCFLSAMENKTAIPTIPSKDSLRKMIDYENSVIIDRSKIVQVQTPQVFEAELLKTAYRVSYQDSFTDDASVVEYSNHRVHLIEGGETNFKITTPLDLKVAEFLISQK